MSSSGGAPSFKTIWELSPAELEVLKADVKGYLDGLRVTHFTYVVMTTLLVWDIIITWDREAHYVWKTRWSYAKFIFLFNRYLGPLTFLLVLDASHLPGWILAFTIGAKYIDPTQLRIYGNVMTYIGGVSMPDGYDAVNWRLKKCYRFPFPKHSWTILIGAVLYESGIFAALIFRMYKDQKLTRIIEAFYRDGIGYYLIILSNYAITLGVGFCSNTPAGQGFVSAAFYIGIKSMTCSHIILRLRSYFSLGDPVVDGRPETDPFDRDWKMVGNTTSSSFVSTIIQFAHMITGTTTGTTFNIKSKHLSRREERQTMDLEGAGEGGHEAARRESTQFTFRVMSPTLASSSPTSPRESLDWTSNPIHNSRRTRLDDPSLPRRSDVVVDPSADPLSQPHSNQPGWLSRRLGSPDRVSSEGNRRSGTFGPTRYLGTLRPWEEPSIIEMDNLADASQDVETTRRSTGYPDPEEHLPPIPASRPSDASHDGAHYRHPHPRREGSWD